MDDRTYIEATRRTDPEDGYRAGGAIVTRLALPRTAALLHYAMGIVTEAGELLDAVKKHAIYGRDLDTVNLVEEVGDLQWYEARLLDLLGTDFADARRRNVAKLRRRYPDGFTEEAATVRDLDAERAVLAGPVDDPAGAVACTDVRGDVHRLAAAIDALDTARPGDDEPQILAVIEAATGIGGAILRGVVDDWHATQVALAESGRVLTPDEVEHVVAVADRPDRTGDAFTRDALGGLAEHSWMLRLAAEELAVVGQSTIANGIREMLRVIDGILAPYEMGQKQVPPREPTGFDRAPDHYAGEREVIDAIRDELGDDLFVGFCIGNAIKYERRSGRKGDPVGDADKATWYRAMARHVTEGDVEDPRVHRSGWDPDRDGYTRAKVPSSTSIAERRLSGLRRRVRAACEVATVAEAPETVDAVVRDLHDYLDATEGDELWPCPAHPVSVALRALADAIDNAPEPVSPMLLNNRLVMAIHDGVNLDGPQFACVVRDIISGRAPFDVLADTGLLDE